ncbi:MAG: PTS sugar transporter subunit IIB [Bacilli bacterium]
MINILLICSAGMSTSLMVEKMRIVAQEENIEANIWAVAELEADNNIVKADVVLIGPQIRFKLEQIRKQANGRPVEAIDMRAYGMMDGKLVFEQARKMSS